MVRNDDFRESVELEHMVNEQPSILLCSNFLAAADKMYHFGKSINEYGDGGYLLRLWQICDQVCRNLLPLSLWQGIGCSKPVFFLWSDFIS